MQTPGRALGPAGRTLLGPGQCTPRNLPMNYQCESDRSWPSNMRWNSSIHGYGHRTDAWAGTSCTPGAAMGLLLPSLQIQKQREGLDGAAQQP